MDWLAVHVMLDVAAGQKRTQRFAFHVILPEGRNIRNR